MKNMAKRYNVITLLIILLCATVIGGSIVFVDAPSHAVSADTSITTTALDDLTFTLNSEKTGYKVRAKNRIGENATIIYKEQSQSDL